MSLQTVCSSSGRGSESKRSLFLQKDIQLGDFVLEADEGTGETALKAVVQTFVNETNELIHIKVNGELEVKKERVLQKFL